MAPLHGLLVVFLWVCVTLGSSPSSFDRLLRMRHNDRATHQAQAQRSVEDKPRAYGGPKWLNHKTKEFAVDGASFPGVDFDIGESYAGLLPITGNASDPNEIFFWFFPSQNAKASKEVVVWFQGGPGCSSLVALLQENGPFLWQPGVYKPYPNPYAWNKLTNMVWIDQPYGVGLAQGNTTVKDPTEAARQFMGFWKNFVKTFSMQGFKVYLVGESYGGSWVSYLAQEMLAQNDTKNFNLKAIQLQDPFIGDLDLQTAIPSIPAMHRMNKNFFFLNDSFVETVTQQAKDCGILDFYDKYIDAYPPPGPLPPVPDVTGDCDVLNTMFRAVTYINPCVNPYHITDVCPFPWTVMGYGSFSFNPGLYFNRSDVQDALHVPRTDFSECSHSPGLLYGGVGDPPAFGPLPGVVDQLDRVVVSNGGLDFAIFSEGVRLALQNMTWGGRQGFQKAPSATPNLFVPYHDGLEQVFQGTFYGETDGVEIPFTQTAGAGLIGSWQTERGLTFVDVFQAGHQLPQYAPGAAYRIMEFMLGRIDSLDQRGDFT